MDRNAKIYIAGHNGLVGSAIKRNLEAKGFANLIVRSHKELDLTNQVAVGDFFATEKPDYVFLAAAHVGGILANSSCPADFYYINSMIQNNVIHNSYHHGVKKLLFLGSSCIYPKACPQPIKEEYLLSGYLEPTNEAYAIAKISGLKMCQYYNKQYETHFISCMPTNLYGENDNFDLTTSHVLPALLRKFHEAKSNGAETVTIWGTGAPLREFLHVDDMADACVFLMENYNGEEHVNIGSGREISILNLAKLMKNVVGYTGGILFDQEKPDGMARKFLDCSKLFGLGWNPQIELEDGLRRTYEWYLRELAK